MRPIGYLLLALGLSGPAIGGEPSLKAVMVEEGVLIESSEEYSAAALTLRGPGQYVRKMKFAGSEAPIIDASYVDGAPLTDGLYKYEVVLSPMSAAKLAKYDAKHKDSNFDRNAFSGMTDPKVSPFSGSFRVVDGLIVDSELSELEMDRSAETSRSEK